MGIGPSLEDLLPSKKVSTNDDTSAEKLQSKMKALGIKEKETEAELRAQSLGLPYIDLAGFPIGPDSLMIIDRKVATAQGLVCFFNNGREIRLATPHETQEIRLMAKDLAEKKFANVIVYLVSQHSFDLAMKLYDNLPEEVKIVSGVDITEDDLKKFENALKDFRDFNMMVRRISLTDLVAFIISTAVQSRASDIHIEAEENDVK
ncbi:MAG: hypothetical protein WCL61_03200, partial [bacterium]